MASFHVPIQDVQTETRKHPSNPTDQKRVESEGFWERAFSDPTSFFTLVIAGFTIILAAATVALFVVNMISANAARSAARTAEKALTDVERPYVFVFGVTGFKIDKVRPGGLNPHVTFSVANYGKTPAIIERVAFGFSLGAEPDDLLYADAQFSLVASPIMQAGERRDGLFCDAPEFDPADVGWLPLPPPSPIIHADGDLLFRVIINYRGPFTRSHETSACWRFEQGVSVNFVLLSGDEYNYQR